MKRKMLAVLLASCMTASGLAGGTVPALAEEAQTEAAGEARTEAEEERSEAPDVDAAKYLTISDENYKGLEIVVAPKEQVTDREVEEEILQEASEAGLDAQVKEGTVREGDTVNIDYVGKKDGKAFDGGTAQGYDLTIGSGTFIDGFEDGLIGTKIGDTVDLNLTFPENYGSKDLAGQAVVFTVTVNYVKGDPELDDDLAEKLADLTDGKEKTLKDLKEAVRDRLQGQKDAEYNAEVYTVIFSKLMELYPIEKYPQDFIDYYVNTNMSQLEDQAQAQSESVDDLLKSMYGTDAEEFKNYYSDYAKQLLQQRIILGVIGQKEKITLDEDGYQAALQDYADSYGVSVEDFLHVYDDKMVRESEYENQVMKFLADHAKITDQAETESEDLEELVPDTEADTEAE